MDVSVVISTYNRCDLLPEAIDSLARQAPGGPAYELIVVDNNSTDGTREVVADAIRRYGDDVVYVFEGRQGLSHARNAGIARARAPIVAFTDDDVRASPVWVREIKRAFDEHPTVDFVGGRVLPRWPAEPPAWLTRAHWSPLALVDYGDEDLLITARNPRCLVGANMAFRRHLFTEFGLYDPAYQHQPGSVSSIEDHEFELRLLKAGRTGLYRPSIVMHAAVQPNRLEKRYHRKWHLDHGRALARLLQPTEDFDASGMPVPREPGAPYLLGAPAWLYRECVVHGLGAVRATLAGDEAESLAHAGRAREALGQIHVLQRRRAGASLWRAPRELLRFTAALARRRLHAHAR